jgi:hypothetical protein
MNLAIEQNKGTKRAAVKGTGIVGSEEKPAAAAPLVASHQNQKPAAAPRKHGGNAQAELNFAGSPGEPPSNQGEKPEVQAQAEALVEELHAVHPQPGLPDKATGEVKAILAKSEDVAATVALIRSNHALWKAHWESRRAGQFIPQLWRWFHDGEWRRAVGKPVRSETYTERADRLQREYKSTPNPIQDLYDNEMKAWREKQRRFA